jgi:hypothetical protein
VSIGKEETVSARYPQSIILIIRSRRKRWAGHMARRGMGNGT